jgi:hypothetical protein
MEAMLTLFGEVSNEPETYGAAGCRVYGTALAQ